jgi:hypothetical protein
MLSGTEANNGQSKFQKTDIDKQVSHEHTHTHAHTHHKHNHHHHLASPQQFAPLPSPSSPPPPSPSQSPTSPPQVNTVRARVRPVPSVAEGSNASPTAVLLASIKVLCVYVCVRVCVLCVRVTLSSHYPYAGITLLLHCLHCR